MATPRVLIAGAGPTGLVLALWLTRSGIPVRLIDKASAPGMTSRALVFHARNLEFYRQLGIDRIAIERGEEFKTVNLWREGVHVAHLPFGRFGEGLSRYPYALIFPQDAHEKMLIEQLAALGVEVERGTELIDLTFAGETACAKLRKPTGEREIWQAAYVAGCDGARSTVREKLGVDFPGGTYSDTFYVADIEAHGPVLNGEMHAVLGTKDFLVVFPMKGPGCARLVGTLRPEAYGVNTDSRKFTWEDACPRIIENVKIEVEKVNWFSTYRVHHRVAASFRKHGVFLLGDAAHIHSPVGGQGMNTGIGDAINLAWKLAAVLKGVAPAALLDTYEPERIAFARRLVASTDRAFAVVSSRKSLASWLRVSVAPRVMPLLFRISSARRLMFRTLSQIAISYPQSALSRGATGTVKGGERLPWVRFDAQGTADNYECLNSREWQVHSYGNAPTGLRDICEACAVELYEFPWNAKVRRAGLRKNAAYVVRPDGHVGIADPLGAPENISKYLKMWLPGLNS